MLIKVKKYVLLRTASHELWPEKCARRLKQSIQSITDQQGLAMGLPGATRLDSHILPPDKQSYHENGCSGHNSHIVEK